VKEQAVPFVSVIMPCRNEAGGLARCLDSIIANDHPKERLEVLMVDGMSDDGTREIIAGYLPRYPFLHLLDNPRKITPAALNLGILRAQGEIIVRMDAHNQYPAHYISGLVAWLQKSGADNVGGLWITLPANDTPKARAIAAALSHPFGVGNAHYRIGTSEPRFVDTVPFGCYRRAIFDRIGLFDETLVRNQDDELNLRLIRSGGRILLVPEIVSYYTARDTLKKVWRMYYQYGYFKPQVVQKIGRVMTVRQMMPALFILALFGSAALAPAFQEMRIVFHGLVFVYLTADVIFSVPTLLRQGIRTGLALGGVFPVLHFSYGLGFLKGALDLLWKRDIGDGAEMPISR
jgi:glycosyltransferase involved in cell wall biosynthesis